MKKEDVIKEIQLLFEKFGSSKYGENVTQTEHAVQCYMLAEESNADVELRVAAFLHDVGHLMQKENSNTLTDLKHEDQGSQMILKWGFGEKVSILISSHVWAKRYLVSCEPYYINLLSAASIKSFQLQGGIMSDEEVMFAREQPYFREALLLRRWDDSGKIVDLEGSEIPKRIWLDILECLEINAIA